MGIVIMSGNLFLFILPFIPIGMWVLFTVVAYLWIRINVG